jgi:arylsulfatase A-like enzyme
MSVYGYERRTTPQLELLAALFGEHGLWEHGNSLCMPVLHVPLIMRAPGQIPPGARVRQPVSLRDLGLTVLDLVDGASSDEPELGGRSLRPTWDSTASGGTSEAVSALSHMRWRRVGDPIQWHLTSIVDDSLHLIRGDGYELLFDVRVDPQETANKARTPSGQAQAETLRAQLGAALQAGVEAAALAR